MIKDYTDNCYLKRNNALLQERSSLLADCVKRMRKKSSVWLHVRYDVVNGIEKSIASETVFLVEKRKKYKLEIFPKLMVRK